jgi:ferritin-like metal-binding protein YciE
VYSYQERIQTRVQHHLEETKEQQDRLRELIIKGGGIPTQEKGRLSTVNL